MGNPWVIGLDEVGRGPLAGPVVAGGVLVREGGVPVQGVRDSKKLTPGQRRYIAKELLSSPAVRTHVAARPACEVDERGMSAVLGDCFGECLRKLLEHVPEGERDGVLVLVDGLPPKRTWWHPRPGEALRFLFEPRADDTYWAVGAASIVAKVARDAWMAELAKDHAGYGWERNSGYGTPEHVRAIAELGLSPEHRRTFCKRLAVPAGGGVPCG